MSITEDRGTAPPARTRRTGPSPLLVLLRQLRPMLWPMLWTGFASWAGWLSLMAISVLGAWGVGHAVVLGALPPAGLWWGLGLAVAVRVLLTWHEMDISHALAYRVLDLLRMRLFDSYAARVVQGRQAHSGEAASTALTDLEKLEFFYAHTIAQIASAVLTFLVGVVALSLLDPAMGAAVVLLGALLMASSLFLRGAMRQAGQDQQRETSELSTFVTDALGNARDVLSFSLTGRIVAEAEHRTARISGHERRAALLQSLAEGVRDLLTVTALLAVLLLGLRGALAPELLAVAVTLAMLSLAPLIGAADTLGRLHPLQASAARVTAHLTDTTQPTDTAQSGEPTGTGQSDDGGQPCIPESAPDTPWGVQIRGLRHRHPGREELRFPEISVRAGEHVGISGPSGVGKTSLVNLIAGLWRSSSGTVELLAEDGARTPQSIPASELRRRVAVVDQESRLFRGTVAQNLRMGLDRETAEPPGTGLSDDALRAALTAVGADRWITLEDELGETGLRLSGGQRARLCLARALVRRPALLILDEVTASLDAESEQEIIALVRSLDCTVLTVSHRASTLATADRIIVL